MKNIIAFPVLALALMIQTSLVSRITLLSGAADLILLILVAWSLQEQVQSSIHWAVLAGLMTAFVSGLPPYVYPLGYLLTVMLSRYVLKQTWQNPILALFSVVFFSTIMIQLLTYLSLVLIGSKTTIGDTLALITLPSLLLNLLLALPVHSFMGDLALWVYPLEDLG